MKARILFIMIFFISCESQITIPGELKSDIPGFIGNWEATTVSHEDFEPIGWTFINGGHREDAEFRTVFEFVPDRCYVRRSRAELQEHEFWGHSRTYSWTFNNEILKLISGGTGTHYFSVDFINRTEILLTEANTGKIILLNKQD